jgi:hypothetical protein
MCLASYFGKLRSCHWLSPIRYCTEKKGEAKSFIILELILTSAESDNNDINIIRTTSLTDPDDLITQNGRYFPRLMLRTIRLVFLHQNKSD